MDGENNHMIKSLNLTNFLSFGNESNTNDLSPLNILIGTNGSGKSNFLEAFDLLQNAATNIFKPIRESGGVSDWVYKGSTPNLEATLDFVILNKLPRRKYDELRYKIAFSAVGQGFEITDEQLVCKNPDPGEQ